MIADNDPAGMGIAFTNAINRHSEHKCRLITRKTLYNFDYQKDIHIPDLTPDGFDQVSDLLNKTDIIHFHTLVDETWDLGPIHIKDYIKGKTILHHHHGHPAFRSNPEKFRDKYRQLKRKALVSTPDLLKLLPEASWMPNLVPIDDPFLKPNNHPKNGKVRVGQSPTRKDLKNTQEFLSVVAELQSSFPSLECKIMEMLPHRQCLIEKNSCHIIFDHMQGYYGVSSLESLSQGKPVIAGLDDWNRKTILEFFSSEELPWVLAANATELKTAIKNLIESKALREQAGKRSRYFMETFWNENKVVNALMNSYERHSS